MLSHLCSSFRASCWIFSRNTRDVWVVLVSDGQNEGPLNNGSDIYCSACSPLVWDNLGLFHVYMYRMQFPSMCTCTGIQPLIAGSYYRHIHVHLHSCVSGNRQSSSHTQLALQVLSPVHTCVTRVSPVSKGNGESSPRGQSQLPRKKKLLCLLLSNWCVYFLSE